MMPKVRAWAQSSQAPSTVPLPWRPIVQSFNESPTVRLDAIDQDEAPRKEVSLTDPTARWTAVVGGKVCFTWSTNHLFDVETSVISDVEATPAHRAAEVDAAKA